MITKQEMQQILDKLVENWYHIDHEFGPYPGGLLAAIANGEEPEMGLLLRKLTEPDYNDVVYSNMLFAENKELKEELALLRLTSLQPPEPSLESEGPQDPTSPTVLASFL